MERTLTLNRLNIQNPFKPREHKSEYVPPSSPDEVALPPIARRILSELLADPNSLRNRPYDVQYLRIQFRFTNPDFIKAVDSFVDPDTTAYEEAATRANNLTAALGYQQRGYDVASIIGLTGVNVESVDGLGTPLDPNHVQAARAEAERLEAEGTQATQQSKQAMLATAKALVAASDLEQPADQD